MQNSQDLYKNIAVINALINEHKKNLDKSIKKKQRILRNPIFVFDQKFRRTCRQNLAFDLYKRGNLTKSSDDYTSAIQEYRGALRRPNERRSGDLRHNLGLAYCARGSLAKDSGNYTSAIQDYTSAIQEHSEALKFLVEPSIQGQRQLSLGAAFYQRGLITNSSEDFAKALEAYNAASCFPCDQDFLQRNIRLVTAQLGAGISNARGADTGSETSARQEIREPRELGSLTNNSAHLQRSPAFLPSSTRALGSYVGLPLTSGTLPPGYPQSGSDHTDRPLGAQQETPEQERIRALEETIARMQLEARQSPIAGSSRAAAHTELIQPLSNLEWAADDSRLPDVRGRRGSDHRSGNTRG